MKVIYIYIYTLKNSQLKYVVTRDTGDGDDYS